MFPSGDDEAYLPSLLDAEVAPDSLAEWARAVTPGSAVVKPLTHLRPAQLSPAGRVDAVAALEAQIAWLQARQLELIAALATDCPVSGDGRRFVTEEISCALRLSHSSAEDRVALAETLAHDLPATLQAVERGAITVGHARYLVEQTRDLDAAERSAVEQRVLPRASGQSHSDFRRAVRRAKQAVDTRAAELRHQAARRERRVELFPGEDGMATVWAVLPADGAQLLMGKLNAAARSCCEHDERTMDQRRADALVDLATGVSGAGETRPAVQVTVALSTLLGLDDDPGELAGHGPIPAALAREIAADPSGTWRRLVTDERGQLLDVGRRRYRPPASMRRFVQARDRTCRFPHCHQPAARAEIDHVQDWQQLGPTNPDNLQPLCRRHHHTKHDGGWRVHRSPDGATHWTSPLGRRYRKAPATHPAGGGPPPY